MPATASGSPLAAPRVLRPLRGTYFILILISLQKINGNDRNPAIRFSGYRCSEFIESSLNPLEDAIQPAVKCGIIFLFLIDSIGGSAMTSS